MDLDLNTLFLVTIYVDVILGLLLWFTWFQNPGIRAVLWWGCAHVMRAGAVLVFAYYGMLPDVIAIDLAHTLLFLSFAVDWAGARVFDGRRLLPWAIVAGAALWLTVSHLPVFVPEPDFRFLIASGIITAYTWLSAYEFWRGRREPLLSRWPAIFMLFAQGALFMLPTRFVGLWSWWAAQEPQSVWLTLLSFEALLFTIAIAFVKLAMAKERTEYRHRIDAMIDPLTGIANRRSFLNDAAGLAGRRATNATMIAVLVIDLDDFKSVNDRFGHAVGDRVLQIFAVTAKAMMRPCDLLGRLGGEEFAAVLPHTGPDHAVAVAEDVRRAFSEAAAEVDGWPVGATLSVGVVHHQGAALDLSELLLQADQALYGAKQCGRNCVEFARIDTLRRRREPAPCMVAAEVARNAA